MSLALETVVKQLADSGIVAPGKLENFVPPKASPKDAEELLRELFKQNLLTKFQAQQVAAGKAKALILGEYTILDKIGAGGMGQVFKAEHRRMKRLVAIKMLPPATTKDAAALARFQREVEAAAKLEHPNIVTAHDAGQAGTAHFLVMQYVEGNDLSALVKKDGPLSVDKAVNYILQAARGLEFAHGEGVIHRDIKPANLLLDKKGTVKILDLGLARIDSGGNAPTQAELTGTGAVMGTVDYMAPEQARSTHHADARADIYSLGCSLFYLLTARPLYDGDTVTAKLISHQFDPIPTLGDIRPDVPPEVQAIYEKMIAKKVEDRYQTMTEVIADLQACGMGPGGGMTMVSGTQVASSSPLSNSNLSFLKDAAATHTVQRTTHKHTQIAKPTSASDRRLPKRGVLIGAGVLGIVVLLAAIIVSLRTKDGTLVVEVDQPDAMVQVLDAEGKVEVSQKGGAGKVTISVDPGKHRLRVEKDGFVVFGQEFEMEKGGKKAIAARLTAVKAVPLAGQPSQPWNTPAFQAWMKTAAAMPAEEQVKAVSKKLMELNPGFDGKVAGKYASDTPKIENGVVVEIFVLTDNVADISPVQALPGLRTLTCRGTDSVKSKLSDLSPLQGMQLAELDCSNSQVSDLSALQGMSLTTFSSSNTPLSDLTPLKGMPLTRMLLLTCPQIKDLSPLEGMPLTSLELYGTAVSDLSPLNRMPLKMLGLNGTRVTDLSPLKGLPLERLSCQFTQVSVLTPLESCKHLQFLSLISTKVTAKSIAALQKALPNCKIQWDDPTKATTPQPAIPTGPVPPLAVAPFDAAQAKAHQEAWAKHLGTEVETTNSVGMTMVLIPPGEFMMGSTDEQVEAALKVAEEIKAHQTTIGRIQKAERPQHKVVITKPFLLSATEVTVGQFKKFSATGFLTEAEKMALGDPKAQTYLSVGSDDLPASYISWNDAVAYCDWLTKQASQADGSAVGEPTTSRRLGKYRLPTEAEWEYAYRAGTTTQYSFGDDYNELPKYGWHRKNSGGKSHPVGTLLPNSFGLFDMHGNLQECCGDYYDEKWYSASPPNVPNGPSVGSDRVVRGGNFNDFATSCRSAYRHGNPPSHFHSYFGVRCVSELAVPATTASITPQPTVPTAAPAKPITDFNSPEFQAWVKQVQAMPAKEQVEEVVEKLQKLNAGFDGKKTVMIENGAVTEFRIFTDDVTDISPVRALSGLKRLACVGTGGFKGRLVDLSPLTGLQLTYLSCYRNRLSELSPLIGMPLTTLFCSETKVSDLTPLTGMLLTEFDCDTTQVMNLAPLRDMPLTRVKCSHTLVTDLSPLADCKGLDTLKLQSTKVTPAAVAALQKALPNCKIEWDDPAKATTPQPAASGTK